MSVFTMLDQEETRQSAPRHPACSVCRESPALQLSAIYARVLKLRLRRRRSSWTPFAQGSGMLCWKEGSVAEYANKVWEWDFKPTGDRSFTRPGWRLLAYIPNPRGPEPILARPFVCWDKSQAPKGNQATFVAKALKKFLSETVKIVAEEEVFHYTVDKQGKNIALCRLCWDRVESFDLEELEILKATHKQDCTRHPPSN